MKSVDRLQELLSNGEMEAIQKDFDGEVTLESVLAEIQNLKRGKPSKYKWVKKTRKVVKKQSMLKYVKGCFVNGRMVIGVNMEMGRTVSLTTVNLSTLVKSGFLTSRRVIKATDIYSFNSPTFRSMELLKLIEELRYE